MASVEVPKWLKSLPLAPEYRPTETEFADPIAFISRIEQEASAFGICKVIPPLPKPSKRFVFANLNRSLSKSPELGTDARGGGEAAGHGAMFTTRHQELGSRKSGKGAVHKQVWQSGEVYTVEQFEAKSKVFARAQLGSVRDVTPLAVESMFWKAALEKPMYIEYANDVPGSGFGALEDPSRCFSHRHKRKKKLNPRGKNTLIAASDASRVPVSLISGSDMEGTAGWKLSNSPWNLQVIARSPGSLTRFMPDEVPGVTSPMIYIGMLFSWFAWHVEDHELHSLNFLHTGSPKTWYAVPGDHASTLEDIVRFEGYGGDLDRLDALIKLGEKRTLFSPEVLVESGIPCCRLVQNPGEFVVTFPRAYHVGFSHGFNCGEAANFATSKWLRVAKDAAVRRAAMNYLPMLSHQQLLYMLAISFISRVPRELIPGARSSRFRDRRKEEREDLVKKAFLDDILNELELLHSILGKESTIYAVIWDHDMLSLPNDDEQALLPSQPTSEQPCHLYDKYCGNEAILPNKGEEKSLNHDDHIRAECFGKEPHQDYPTNASEVASVLTEMNCVDDIPANLHVDDELPCGLDLNSGMLACVACGILGYPFMSIVQPSSQALNKIFPSDNAEMLLGNMDDSKLKGSVSNLYNIETDSGLGSGNDQQISASIDKKWNTSNPLLRPRTFCLQHALEVHVLLKNKGDSNVLVLCHSDYLKIKAQVISTADEFGAHFVHKEISIGDASKSDLNLINASIDDDECEESEVDWTSRLGLNLRYCVKLRKESSSKKERLAMALNNLFSDPALSSVSSRLRWLNRKIRTRTMTRQSSEEGPMHVAQHNIDVIHPKSKVPEVSHLRNSFTLFGNKEGADSRSILSGFMNCAQQKSRTKTTEVAPATTYAFEESESNQNWCAALENEKLDKGSSVLSVGVKSEKDTFDEFDSSSLCAASGYGDSDHTERECQPTLISSGVERDEVQNDMIPVDCAVTDSKGDDALMNSINITHPVTMTDIIFENQQEVLITSKMKDDHKCNVMEKHLKLSTSLVADSQIHPGTSVDEDPSLENQNNDSLTFERQHSATPSSYSDSKERKIIQITETCCEVDVDGQISIADSSIICYVRKRKTRSEREPTTDFLGCVKPAPAEEEDTDACDIENMCHTKRKDVHASSKDRKPSEKCGKRTNREVNDLASCQYSSGGFVRSPCEGLRMRIGRTSSSVISTKEIKSSNVNMMKRSNGLVAKKGKGKFDELYSCKIECCLMRFRTKEELALHKRNRCTYDDCGKRFRNHKYATRHQRVHADERPLKCSWKGCTMSFKWAWARTEHLRVHTGERPYKCKVTGCGLTFRFVSDFSRHRRKTGHYVNSSE